MINYLISSTCNPMKLTESTKTLAKLQTTIGAIRHNFELIVQGTIVAISNKKTITEIYFLNYKTTDKI